MKIIYNRLLFFGIRIKHFVFRVQNVLKKEGINGLSNRVRTQLSLHSASRNILHIQNRNEIVPKVSIIIPVFNALSLTQECLRSLSGDTHNIEYEIIIVDNASKDNTPNWLREESKKNASLRIFTMEKNVGFGPAVNFGIRQSRGEFIVILNNDTIVAKGWLGFLINAMEKDDSIGIVSPVTNYVGEDLKLMKMQRSFPQILMLSTLMQKVLPVALI